MVALATAFIALAPQLNPAAFTKAGSAAGAAAGAGAGTKFGAGFNKGSAGMFKGMKARFAGAANLLVPLGIVAAIAQIGRIGTAYEDNLNIFQAVTKATGAQMDQVANKARELGADLTLPGVSAAGSVDAMNELAKAGFTVQQSMDAAKATLQLARISMISEGDAAVVTANAVNAFGIAAKDTTFVVDELAAAANSSSVDIHDVELAFRQASATFSGFQGPVIGAHEAITEMNTAIAILGNNGIKGSDAGTSLKQMLLQLTGPTERAKVVMEELAARAGGANVSLEQQKLIIQGSKSVRDKALQSIYKQNKGLKDEGDIAYTAAGKMRSLPEIIDLVTRGTKGMTDEQKNAAITQIFGADATRSIIALMKGGLPTYEKMRKAVLQQGAAAEFARAKNIGLKGSLDNVRSQLENIAIELYNQVKGPLRDAFNSLAANLQGIPKNIAEVSKFVHDNAGAFHTMATAVRDLAAAWLVYRTAIIAASVATRAWIALQGLLAFVALAAGVRSLADAWALLSLAMDANPFGLIVLAVAALVAGLIYAYKHSEAFRKIVNAVGAALKTAFVASINFITQTLFPSLIRAYDQAKTATLFLYHNVILPVWNAIKTAISAVVTAVQATIGGLVAAFNAVRSAFNVVAGAVRAAIGGVMTAFRAVGAAAVTVYNVFRPVFDAIGKVLAVFRLIFLVVAYAFANIVKATFIFYLNLLKTIWNAVFAFMQSRVEIFLAGVKVVFGALRTAWNATFNFLKAYVQTWWNVVRLIFNFFYSTVVGPLVNGVRLFGRGVTAVFNALSSTISAWWKTHVSPIFTAVRTGWNLLSAAISNIWNRNIKPIFTVLGNYLKNNVVGAFKTGVALIGQAWNALKEAAKAPVKFVVNAVLNPFIGGLNAAAKAVGVPAKYQVSKINLPKGFAEGGQVPEYAAGGRIAGAPSSVDNRMAQATIPGVGAVKLAGGEFIVNARDTMKALPLLRWINDGMRGGAGRVGRYIGRPLTEYPGDGSEGWAFKDGGLVGWVKDVWSALSDPVQLIKRPFENMINQIPGSGVIKSFLVGAGKKLVDAAIHWITGGVGGNGVPLTGKMGAAASFLRAQNGKPYVWASAGPNGYDCSGIVSAVYNILKGQSPYSHTFSTEGLPDGFFRQGQRTGALLAGWSHPGQSPASASVGHMAGQLANLPFESRGSRGVIVGAGARNISTFANIGAARFAKGGMFGSKIRLFDSGGYWPSGTLGANLSGRTEYVNPRGAGGGGDTFHFHFHSAIGDKRAAQSFVLDAYNELKRERKI